ncbi:MAG: hypothetical protein WC876_01700 [Candidatus Thermoplasmatota archaeon]|jgi:hypothetical protein
MSLGVYLEGPEVEEECRCAGCGHAHTAKTRPTLYGSNITHNLGKMADAAGIYQVLWRPEELGIARAAELVPLLELGLGALRSDPAKFRALEPSNGWGTYAGFVPWVEAYLAACREYPGATVRASR